MYTLWGKHAILLALFLDSRLITSCHVTHHVTAVIHFFIVQKEKENQKKRNIKSRKINNKKRKMSKAKCIITHGL